MIKTLYISGGAGHIIEWIYLAFLHLYLILIMLMCMYTVLSY